MNLFRILLTDGLEQSGLDILRRSALVNNQDGISPEELVEAIGAYQAVIVRGRTRLTADLLKKPGQLKVIGRAGVGVDNIDLQAARKAGICVVNSPEATTGAVAELVISLMFSLARNLTAADQSMKRGEWEKKRLVGGELRQKTLGIIGMGRIGSEVCRLAKALGMSVLGFDPYLAPETIAHCGAEPLSEIAELYAQADYISLHVPLTHETRGSIDSRAFSQMKPGASIISTARGGVINESDLLASLKAGRLAGAALDVFENEPPGLTELAAHPRVIATPHIGAQTREAQERAAVDIATEVLAALHGQHLRWRVA